MKPTIDKVKSGIQSAVKNHANFQLTPPSLIHLPNFVTQSYFAPFATGYISPLTSLKALEQDFVLQVRDGLYDLIQFFMANPKPSLKTKAVLLIPVEFENFVPKNWRTKSLSYQHQRIEKHFIHGESKILIIGNLGLDTSNLHTLGPELSKVRSTSSKVFALIDNQRPAYSRNFHQYESDTQRLYQSFYTHLPNELNYIEERDLFGMGINHDWKIIDLTTEKFLISDTWYLRHLISLGAKETRPKIMRISSDQALRIQVSPNENMIVDNWNKNAGNAFEDLYLESRLLKIDRQDFHRVFREDIRNLFYQYRT